MSRLADAVGMSKSGLFAHFGSKEELQLATIEKADSVFSAHVIEPALAVGGGLGQLRTLVSGYLAYLEADIYPGGCFFASVLAEVDTQPGEFTEFRVIPPRGSASANKSGGGQA